MLPRKPFHTMANPYIHNSTLTSAQVQAILHGYTRFQSPKEVAAQIGVSRQTTHSLYLKFSQRLHAAHRWEQAAQDEARRDIFQWLAGREIHSAYALYREGPALEDYRVTRTGRMLSPEEYGPYVVARELKEKWGKISEKAFVFHYALIRHTAECRIDWMQFFGTDDITAPNVALMAAGQVCQALQQHLHQLPLGGRKYEN